MNKQQQEAIEFAFARKARCQQDAAQFQATYDLARSYAYFGDEHNDPSQNTELVAACNGLTSLRDAANRAAKEIAAQIEQLPGYAEYVGEFLSGGDFDFGEAAVSE